MGDSSAEGDDQRIRMRTDQATYNRWHRTCAAIDPALNQADVLSVLMDVAEHYPNAVEDVREEFPQEDAEVRGFVLSPRTAGRWDHYAKRFDSDEAALRSLLDLVDDNPELLPSLTE